MKSYTSYWQNEYHHIDKPSNQTDSFLSFYKSFQRRSLDTLKHSSCRLLPLRILESTAYFVHDHYNGVLVSYEAQHQKTGQIVVLESHFIHYSHFIVSNPEGPISRLLNLEVIIVNRHKYSETCLNRTSFEPSVLNRQVFWFILLKLTNISYIETLLSPHQRRCEGYSNATVRPSVTSL